MSNDMHPYGGVNPLIDKMIGNAYDIVKYVARYLKEIRYVAENMHLVYQAYGVDRTHLTAVANGTVADLVVVLPANFSLVGLEAVNVIAVYQGIMNGPSSDTFSYKIVDDELTIVINDNLPELVNAEYRITLVRVPTTE